MLETILFYLKNLLKKKSEPREIVKEVKLAPVYSNIYSWFKTTFYVRFNDDSFCLYTNYFKLNVADDYSLNADLINWIENDTRVYMNKSQRGQREVDYVSLIGVVKMSCHPSEIAQVTSMDNKIIKYDRMS